MTFSAAITALVISMVVGGCRSNDRDDDLGSILSDDPKSLLLEDLRGLLFVHQPPPVVQEAQGRLPLTGVTGPKNPQLAWGVALPFSRANIQQIGVDGTVYVADMAGVGAVRDGKLLWAFRTYHAGDLAMADDGRIWIKGYERSGYFCLNRLGQGSLLPASFKLPPNARETLPRDVITAIL